jgi:hypothetical protein
MTSRFIQLSINFCYEHSVSFLFSMAKSNAETAKHDKGFLSSYIVQWI